MTRIETPRLVLRPATLADAPQYALHVGEFAVCRYLTPVPHPYTLGMAIEWLRQVPPPTPERSMFIIEREGRLIGCVSLISELGFWIARPHWGRGYATEAARALLAWHFAHTDTTVVRSSAHHDNGASLGVQRKLGFVPVGRDIRFSHSLQHNVAHVVTQLERDAFFLREPE